MPNNLMISREDYAARLHATGEMACSRLPCVRKVTGDVYAGDVGFEGLGIVSHLAAPHQRGTWSKEHDSTPRPNG